jgi:hypothetical protein
MTTSVLNIILILELTKSPVRSVKNLLPDKTLKTLYYSLFPCYLIYAIKSWSAASPSVLQPLVIKQKATIRIIANKKYTDHTEPLFKALSILPVVGGGKIQSGVILTCGIHMTVY